MSLQVQSDLMAVLWSREELNLPGCQAQLEDSRLLWYGPRVSGCAGLCTPCANARPHGAACER